MNLLQNLGRNQMEISLAKPLSDKRKQAQVKREQRNPFDPPFRSRGGFGDNLQRKNINGPSSGGLGNPPQRAVGPMNRSDDPFSQLDFIREFQAFFCLNLDVNQFGPFAGDSPMDGGSSRGGPSNRGNRGGVSDENEIF